MCSAQAARVALVADAASPVIASRLPTASATTRAVARVRRLRRPTLRRPICIVRGRKRTRRRSRSPASWLPTAEPVDSSASRRSTRVPRRIAGSAARAGPSTPIRAATATTVRSTPKPTSIAKKVEPKKEASRFESRMPSAIPTSVPMAPSRSAVLRYTSATCRRRAPTARMIPISPVCSETSVVMVLEIKTSAERSASSVITPKKSTNRSESSLPGQSPGARTSGRPEKPVKPGIPASDSRTALSVLAAALVSRSRKASTPYPGSPLSAATVSAVA